MKKKITLTESEIRDIVNETVTNIINEISFNTARDAYGKAHDKALDNLINKDPQYNKERKNKQLSNLYNHMDDRKSERFDPNMLAVIVTERGSYKGTIQDLMNNFEVVGYVEPSRNPIYNKSKLIGYPRLKGLLGPMWDGDKIRYESQEVYNAMSI